MVPKVYYYDHNGELQFTFNDDEAGAYIGLESDLKDWTIGYDTDYGLIRNMHRSKEAYTLPVVLPTDSTELRDALVDVFTADILAQSPGKLVVQDWELECYITGATHEWVRELDRVITFAVTPTFPVWIRRTTKHFGSGQGGETIVDLGRDYTLEDGVVGRGYNYGYSVALSNQGTFNLRGEGNGYEAVIYGAVTNGVTFYINNYPISVDYNLTNGQIMKITSNGGERTIVVMDLYGNEIANVFDYRDKENTPFITLPDYVVIGYGNLEMDFTAIERRSEPSWN